MRRKTVTVKQIQKLDKVAIEGFGVPSLALMENAGKAVALEVKKTLGKKKKVCVICGLGNNAGDGFVIARHLINADCKVSIILIGQGKKLKHDALVNYSILRKLGYKIIETKKATSVVLKTIKGAHVVVDAIFGVGLNRNVEDPFKSFIEAINKNAKKVVAVDTPSGLDGTSGKIYGVSVKADKTVTFSFVKKGFLKGEGPKQTGKVVVVDIGIPLKLKKRLR